MNSSSVSSSARPLFQHSLSVSKDSVSRTRGKRPARSEGAASAFTLIELLTVIAIIGILASIIIPVVGKVRESASKASCASNLRQIALGTVAYANENKGLLPTRIGSADAAHAISSQAGSTIWDDLRPYFGNPPKEKLMFCPGPLKDWRNPDYPGGSYSATGRYITYAYFANLTLDNGLKTEFGLETIPLRRLDKVPPRMALWTCFTCRTTDGHYHGHGDADLDATSPAAIKGQNAATSDGAIRWIKGENLMIYSTASVPTYGPKKGS